MTLPDLDTPQLLGFILAGLLLQLGVGIGWSWRRSAQSSRTLRADTAGAAAVAPVSRPAGTAAWPGTRAFRVMARQYEDSAQTQCSFVLQPVDGQPLPPFRPGQYLGFVLELADGSLAGGRRRVTRCYSLSDAPAPDHYRVTIKRVPQPADRPALPPGLSSNHFHDHVAVGDVLQLKAPAGHFHIDDDAEVPAVLVAGGIGITPMMSMLRWCVQQQPTRTVHLVYGVRQGAEQAFKAELEQLALAHPTFHLHVVCSRPASDDQLGRDYQHTGHVDLALLRRTLPHGRHRFFLCGPPAMMAALVPALAGWGVPEQDLHFEAFGPASVRRPAGPDAERASPASALTVRFERSGRTLDWDGQDSLLLDFAERHGVAVEAGCRAGGCGCCETRLLSGTVSYAQPPDHDVAPGHCLLCVGRPTSDLVLEA